MRPFYMADLACGEPCTPLLTRRDEAGHNSTIPGSDGEGVIVSQTRRILLVHGAALDLRLDGTQLWRREIRFLTANDAPQALALARAERPGLAVIDVAYLDPAGLLTCREFRADPFIRNIPTILLAPPAGLAEARRCGADRVVCKPVALGEFLDAVRELFPMRERGADRVALPLRFRYRYVDLEGDAFSRNLSASGAFLATERVVPLGSRMRLEFRLPGESEETGCWCIVRSVVFHRGAQPLRAVGLGVEFDEFDAQRRVRLEQVLEQCSLPPGRSARPPAVGGSR
jgi:CheY-like chemotaxis protein